MKIRGFPAGAFQTNCYVVGADGDGGDNEVVIIDPGQDAAPVVRKILADEGLTPVAVLLTHGHLDHTWNAAELCGEYSIPAYIHPEDRPMLADPAVGIGPALGAMIGDQKFEEPDKVIDLVDGEDIELAGLRFSCDLAPGHTLGSICFGLESDTDTGTIRVSFAGDVLFAGSIGRTDLPGGSHQQLLDSIDRKLLPLPDDTVVLPGHGPQTTIGQERVSNPFLADLPNARPGSLRPGAPAQDDHPAAPLNSKGRHGL